MLGFRGARVLCGSSLAIALMTYPIVAARMELESILSTLRGWLPSPIRRPRQNFTAFLYGVQYIAPCTSLPCGRRWVTPKLAPEVGIEPTLISGNNRTRAPCSPYRNNSRLIGWESRPFTWIFPSSGAALVLELSPNNYFLVTKT